MKQTPDELAELRRLAAVPGKDGKPDRKVVDLLVDAEKAHTASYRPQEAA